MPADCFVLRTPTIPQIFAYRGITIPLLCSYLGGSQGLSPTHEQAHVGSDLLTLVSIYFTIFRDKKEALHFDATREL